MLVNILPLVLVVKKCPAGTYSSTSKSSECKNCSEGKYNPNTGANNEIECRVCSEGKYSPPGSSECFDCPAGTYGGYIDGIPECQKCSIGEYNNKTGSKLHTDCEKCPPWYI